jgi:hypothetical protein
MSSFELPVASTQIKGPPQLMCVFQRVFTSLQPSASVPSLELAVKPSNIGRFTMIVLVPGYPPPLQLILTSTVANYTLKLQMYGFQVMSNILLLCYLQLTTELHAKILGQRFDHCHDSFSWLSCMRYSSCHP